MKYILPPLAVTIIVPMLQHTVLKTEPFQQDLIRCVIAIDGRSKDMTYPIGYNYELLSLFAGQNGKEHDIILGGQEYMDSLKTGAIDIIVVPYSDSLVIDNTFYASIPLADQSAWVINGDRPNELQAINIWLSNFFTTEQHDKTVRRFTPSYAPYQRAASGKKYTYLSPYDDLISKYADSIGWDREMLTALVWQESKFHIEVKSRKGAVGIMQLMPNTVNHYEIDDYLDPDVNLAMAVKYIDRLQKMFKDYAANQEELMNFTLAAYNAGEGRIKDCIAYAISKGAPYSTWNDIVNILPDMRDDSILENENVKLGKFKGHETIRYIESMTSLRKAFSIIAHGRSSQDQPVTQTDTAATKESSQADTKSHPQPEPPVD